MIAKQRLQTLIFFSLFVLSFLLNLYQVFFISSPWDHVYSDMRGYVERSWRLASGKDFLPFDVFYPAGAAYFYAVFFKGFGFVKGLQWITVIQPLLLAASHVLAGLTAWRMFGRASLGVFVTVSTMLFWPFMAQGSFYMAEPLFIFLLLLGQFLFVLTIRDRFGIGKSVFSGLALGLAVLVKGQGICAIFGITLAALYVWRSIKERLLLFFFALAVISPLLAQFYVNSIILGKPSYFLAANDAFNTYLGQSRHEAIGCLDRVGGYFYIFHNNNAGLKYPFFIPTIVEHSITDREYFKGETAKLWQTDFKRQVLYSLQNIAELFSVNPRWPTRNVVALASLDIAFQWVAVCLWMVPALASILLGLVCQRYRLAILLFASPVAFLAGLCGITMGQPRYLLPFHYHILFLSLPFYCELFALFGRKNANTKVLGQNEGTNNEVNTVTRKFLILAVVGAIGVTALLYDAGKAITREYSGTVPSRVDGDQADYFKFVEDLRGKGEIIYFAELGREQKLINQMDDNGSVEILLENFVIGNYWPRKVSWNIQSLGSASMRIKLPQKSPFKIYLFFTDGDSFWRASRVSSGETDIVAKHLHDGKWLEFSISNDEAARGTKEITFQPLTGSGVTLSAILIRNEGN